MSIKHILGTVFLCCLSAACASKPDPMVAYQPAEPESKALQVMKAVGSPIYLKTREEPPSAEDFAKSHSVDIAMFSGLSSLHPPPGFNFATGGVMNLSGWLFDASAAKEEAGRLPRLVMWMPQSEAASAEEARRKIDELVTTALDEAIREILPAPATQERRSFFILRDGKPIDDAGVAFNVAGAPECGQKDVRCQFFYRPSGVKAEALTAPSFLGGYPAWGFTWDKGVPAFLPVVTDKRGLREHILARFPEIEIYRRMSAKLPAWAFIYIEPNKVSDWNAKEGKFTFVPFPLVLNKGEGMFFGRPQ